MTTTLENKIGLMTAYDTALKTVEYARRALKTATIESVSTTGLPNAAEMWTVKAAIAKATSERQASVFEGAIYHLTLAAAEKREACVRAGLSVD